MMSASIVKMKLILSAFCCIYILMFWYGDGDWDVVGWWKPAICKEGRRAMIMIRETGVSIEMKVKVLLVVGWGIGICYLTYWLYTTIILIYYTTSLISRIIYDLSIWFMVDILLWETMVCGNTIPFVLFCYSFLYNNNCSMILLDICKIFIIFSHRPRSCLRLLRSARTHSQRKINRIFFNLRLRHSTHIQHPQNILLADCWLCCKPTLPVHIHHNNPADSAEGMRWTDWP